MIKHYYAFGSICRGEIDGASDIDLLACVSMNEPYLDAAKFSIYSYDRLRSLWLEGNPFAWHLHLESRMLFSSDGSDFLAQLGAPSQYTNATQDCKKFQALFSESYESLCMDLNSRVFHMSCMFLAMRNFATCHSFSFGKPVFSRNAPLAISTKLSVDPLIFDILSRARILSTRAIGDCISEEEGRMVQRHARIISEWMGKCLKTETCYE